MIRNCVVCGAAFTTRMSRHVICSSSVCRATRLRENQKRWQIRHPGRRKAPPRVRHCAVCGIAFEVTGFSRARMCSALCCAARKRAQRHEQEKQRHERRRDSGYIARKKYLARLRRKFKGNVPSDIRAMALEAWEAMRSLRGEPPETRIYTIDGSRVGMHRCVICGVPIRYPKWILCESRQCFVTRREARERALRGCHEGAGANEAATTEGRLADD
jgi:hypothetical protein